jgi:hypothetical protein
MGQRPYTAKQMGDAVEMLVAAELTLRGIPALKAPDNWPHYDIVAQPKDCPPQRITVKARTFGLKGAFVGWGNDDDFDWLAVVLLPGRDLKARRFFFVPSAVALERSHEAKHRNGRGFRIANLVKHLADYEDNFSLSNIPQAAATQRVAAKAGRGRRRTALGSSAVRK